MMKRTNKHSEKSTDQSRIMPGHSDQGGGRYLAAVMFIDVVGFTALVQDDESETLRKLEINRNLVKSFHASHGGRIIQYYGDGTLSVFKSTYDAVSCALEIQKVLLSSDCLPSRIGIHMGDIVERDGAIYGDGVNLASRIQSIGVANSVLVSGEVYKHLHNHPEFSFRNLGTIQFKNVQFPLEIYALDQHNLMVPTKRDLEGKLSTKLRKQPLVSNYMMWIVLLLVASGTVYTYISSQRILSLAAGDNLATLGVLPFDISDLEETDEVLLASFTDEVITDLSALEGMRVISPEASAKIKIHADKPTRELAETMGVTHLLRGEVKKVSNEMTLEVELVDARTGKNKWKHLFHKPFEHLSSVKRDISREIAVKLDASENPFLAEVSRKTASYKVMELYRKARNAASDRTEEGLLRSKAFLERSVAMDDSFALGFAGLSQCYSLMKVYDLIDPDSALFYASENAGKAFKLDRDLAEAYTADALKDYTFFLNDSKDIYELCQHAIQLKPSYDYAYHLIGKVLFDAEHYSEAKSYFNYALRLNPYEYVYQKMTARASEHMGDLEHAEEGYLKLLSNYPENEDALSALIKFYVNHQNWAQVEKYVTEHKDTFGQLCSELYISTQQGSLDIAEKRLETLREKYPERTFAALEASFFDRKGHTDAALKILKEAAYQKQDWIKELKLMPLSDAIRDDSTYLSILEIVKLDSEVIL